MSVGSDKRTLFSIVGAKNGRRCLETLSCGGSKLHVLCLEAITGLDSFKKYSRDWFCKKTREEDLKNT